MATSDSSRREATRRLPAAPRRWFVSLGGFRLIGAAGAALVFAAVVVTVALHGGIRPAADDAPLAGRAIPAQDVATVESAARSCPALTPARLAGQLMATSHFDNDAKLSGGGQGVGGLSEQDWRRWLPRPDAERSDPAANIVALAHEMCDLVGQLRVAHVKGDPWHLALAAVVVGVQGVVAAHGSPGGAAAVFVSTASRYADWYARQPTVDESTTRPDASAEGATTPGHTTPPAATPTAPRSPRTPAAPAPTTGAAPVDLALNHPVTASSYQTAAYAPYQNFPPSLAVDGDGTTRWSSLAQDPSWIYVDLGATHTVSGARLSWETAYSKDYQIRVSNDAKNWITVYEDSAGNGGIDSFTFTPVTARYVEMFSVARAIPAYGVSLWEFEVLGR